MVLKWLLISDYFSLLWKIRILCTLASLYVNYTKGIINSRGTFFYMHSFAQNKLRSRYFAMYQNFLTLLRYFYRIIDFLSYIYRQFFSYGWTRTIDILAQIYCVEAALLHAINYTARKIVVRTNLAVIQKIWDYLLNIITWDVLFTSWVLYVLHKCSASLSSSY